MLLFFICIIFVLFLIIIVFSEFRISIYNFEYSSNIKIKQKENKNKLKFQLYFLGKIKLLSINSKNKKIKKQFEKEIIKERIINIKKKNKLLNKREKRKNKILINEIIKNLKIKSLKLKIIIDTQSVETTSYIIGIASILIPNLVRVKIEKYEPEKCSFQIMPLYQNTNFLYIKLNCIFSIKIVHIINMLRLLLQKEKYLN